MNENSDSDAHSTSIESESPPSPTPAVQSPESLGISLDSSKDLQNSGPIAPESPSDLARLTPEFITSILALAEEGLSSQLIWERE